MSGIYIKNMEMPKGVRPCPFASMDENWKMVCIVGGKHQWHKDRRCDDCPLIEIPEHGRLIDADALDDAFTDLRWTNGDYKTEQLAHWGDRPNWCVKGSEAEYLFRTAPTVIEADKEE